VVEQANMGMAGREIALQRIDRQAEWLEVSLGARLAAFAAGLSPRDLVRIAQREDEPEPDVELRLRNLFAVASYLVARDGAGSAYAWLTGCNSELEGRSPADLLHDGTPPETVWLAAATPF
jgi:hypothetical protein